MLKENLKSGSLVLGTWCDLPSPAVVNVLSKAKLDFVIIDMEHGPMGYDLAQSMVMAAECEGTEALIRVPRLDESDILRALDIGATGVIVPHIESVSERKKAVAFSKFPPLGKRGFNPYVRCGGYSNTPKGYFSYQNKKVVLGLILEGVAGLKNLESIIDSPEVDLIYIGAYDLSLALGVPGEVNHPIVLKELEKAVKKIIRLKKCAGCMVHNSSDLKKFKDMGVKFITYKVDSAIIYDAILQFKGEFDK